MVLPSIETDIEEEPHILTLEDVKELQFSLAMVDAMEEAKNHHRIKVLCLSIWYPLSMSRYFERAFRRSPNVDLKTTGVFTGNWIPWMHGMTVPEKYAKPPDIPLPFQPNVGQVSYEFVKAQLNGWTPDLVISIDAGINWLYKPQDGVVASVLTDPHVLSYDHARRVSDKFFCMQKCYSELDDIYLPYAYDPMAHYPDATTLKPPDTDAILIGMPYTHVPRAQWIEELRKLGVSVIAENGPIFDEYRELANRARIGLNWSSMNDLNARFFETPAFGLPMVTNRVPDAHLFLEEGEDYLGFSDLPEAIEKVLYLKNNPDEAERIARNGYEKIQPHNYDARVQQILQECGL